MENQNLQRPLPLRINSFNGATLIQRGELLGRVSDAEWAELASMGPRLFSVENRACLLLSHPYRHWLQWGHAYSAWRTNRADYSRKIPSLASMGPRLFSVENISVCGTGTDHDPSFNGATLIQRGELNNEHRDGGEFQSFNGATLIQRGERTTSQR